MADPSKVRGILGLFSKAAPAEEGVNLARRGVLGLPRRSEVLLPSQVETHLPAVVSPTPAPVQPPAAIGAIEQVIAEKLAKPTTRREFLGEGVKATASAALRRTLPGALKQATKQLTKPPIDEAAAAEKIADYVNSVYSNEQNAADAYKILSNWEARMARDEWLNDLDPTIGEYLDPEHAPAVWAELKNFGSRRGAEAARVIGLDPKTIAQQTELPQSLVKKIVGNGNQLLNELSEAADYDMNLRQIIEDGRGREAARSSTYLDVLNDEPFLNESLQKAMQELGPNASESALIDRSSQALRERFAAMERGHQNYNFNTKRTEYTPPESESALRSALRKRIISDDAIESVWQQAGEEYNTPDLINDALKAIRGEKPVEAAPSPAAASGQFPWRDDVLRWFESHEATPHGSNKSYVANRALNYGDDTSSWIKDFKKYYDQFNASNPNVPLAEQISTMQSQTGLPAEFIEAIFNRIP
jgi:hypothetical protein